MTPVEILMIVALCAYAVYQQSQRHEIRGEKRFKLAITYGIVGLIVGGFYAPETTLEWVFLGVSVVASVIVGIVRARFTRVWAADGTVYTQGTWISITLFLLLVLSKFILGTVAYFLDVSDDGGFGEVLILIAVMVAIQAELVWRRAQSLIGPSRTGDAAQSSSGSS